METKAPVKVADLFGKYTVPAKKTRRTERGDLLLWISQKTGLNIKRVAFLTTGLKAPDLYYLRSDMEQAAKRGVPYSAAFWHAVRPQPAQGYYEHVKDFHNALSNED